MAPMSGDIFTSSASSTDACTQTPAHSTTQNCSHTAAVCKCCSFAPFSVCCTHKRRQVSVECCYKGSVAHPGVGRHTEACLYSTFPYTQPYIEKERTQFIVHSSSYTVHRTQFIIHSSSYTVHRTQFIVHSSSYTIHRTQFIVHSSSYTVHHRTQFIIHSSPYTVHRTQFIVHTIRLQSVSKPKAQVQVPLAA